MSRLVLSPTPPVECLSTVKVPSGRESKVSPEKRMAWVRAASSAVSRPLSRTAMRKAAVWASEMPDWAVTAWTKAWISAAGMDSRSRLRRMRSCGWKGIVAPGDSKKRQCAKDAKVTRRTLRDQVEGCGEQLGEGALRGAGVAGEEDDGLGGGELGDGLTAGSAGLAGGLIEVLDGDGADADLGPVLEDGGGDGGLFGTRGKPVGGVFDVASGDDMGFAGGGVDEDGGTDEEVAVGRVGLASGGFGVARECGELGGRDFGCVEHRA